jgi:hypothetical protein
MDILTTKSVRGRKNGSIEDCGTFFAILESIPEIESENFLML